jgi:hypothetical protein
MIKYGCQISEQEGNNVMKATTTVSEQGISLCILRLSATLLVSMSLLVGISEQANSLGISEQANYEESIAKGCTEANMFEDYSCKGPGYKGYEQISEQASDTSEFAVTEGSNLNDYTIGQQDIIANNVCVEISEQGTIEFLLTDGCLKDVVPSTDSKPCVAVDVSERAYDADSPSGREWRDGLISRGYVGDPNDGKEMLYSSKECFPKSKTTVVSKPATNPTQARTDAVIASARADLAKTSYLEKE